MSVVMCKPGHRFSAICRRRTRASVFPPPVLRGRVGRRRCCGTAAPGCGSVWHSRPRLCSGAAGSRTVLLRAALEHSRGRLCHTKTTSLPAPGGAKIGPFSLVHARKLRPLKLDAVTVGVIGEEAVDSGDFVVGFPFDAERRLFESGRGAAQVADP